MTAVVLVPVLLLLVLAAPKILTAIVLGLLLALAAYELLYCTGLVRHVRLVTYSAVMAFAVSLWSYFGSVHAYAQLGVIVFMSLLFMEMMLDHVKVTIDKTCMCLFAGLLVPFLLSSLMRILIMKVGRFMILIPFIVAFGSDSGAYFSGRYFGRHKMAPVISQHKTIEGAIGGILTAVISMVIYTMILQFGFDFRVNYALAVLYGLVGSLAGIFGDLCFSVIKRQTGIKDYGHLFPGHGGIMDRFDSVALVAPLMEAFLIILPLAV